MLSNLIHKTIVVSDDTIRLDSFSIIPGSEIVEISNQNRIISKDDYEMNYVFGWLRWEKKPSVAEVVITYRKFPLSFSGRADWKLRA